MVSYFIEQVIERIEKNNSREKVNASEIKLSIDYTKTIEQATANGNYDWKNNNITTKNFPIFSENIGKNVDVLARIFRFNHDIRLEEVVYEMDKAGYRPATLTELLALGSLFPELQKKFPILALGSSMKHSSSSCFFPCLKSTSVGRMIDLDFRFLDRRWVAGQFPDCFLGILEN